MILRINVTFIGCDYFRCVYKHPYFSKMHAEVFRSVTMSKMFTFNLASF